MPATITAKSLILDLLRTCKPSALPVSLLIDTAQIFDINENTLRVNLNRLIQKKAISQDSRGYYQASETTSPLRSWVSTWQLGEKRIKPWQQQWLNLQFSSQLKAKPKQALQRSAYRLGFRQLWDNTWVRPDNLATSNGDLAKQLPQLSQLSEPLAHNSFILMRVSAFHDDINPSSLWPIKDLEKNYGSHIQALNSSINNIKHVDLTKKFRDSFILGGACIHTLAIDPLLPAEMIDSHLRDELTQLMKAYDRRCRPFWQALFSHYPVTHSPAHLEPQLSQRCVLN